MPRSATLPPALRYKPFRGSVAVAAGLLTARQLDGPSSGSTLCCSAA